MKKALRKLLNELDKLVEAGHEEVTDSAVRDLLHEVVYHSFVDPTADYQPPAELGMFSAKDNKKVKAILARFLRHPEVEQARQLPTPQARLDAFQDSEVQSDQGSSYDDYFGYNDGTVIPTVRTALVAKTKKSRAPRFRAGDIIAIPLDEQTFAHGKMYKDKCLGVYDITTSRLAGLHEVAQRPFLFHCYVFFPRGTTVQWPVIGREPFASDDAAEPPPMYHRDDFTGRPEIRHKGLHRPASEAEIAGLSNEIWYSPTGLLERIKQELTKSRS